MHATSAGRIAIALLAGVGAAASFAESVTVVSWGGSYARACEEAYLKPFAAETGIEVLLEDYNGGLSEVRSQVEAGSVHWDIVDIQFPDLIRGCDEGLFETLDTALLAPGADGSAPEDDFYPDLISRCGIAMLFFSTVVAYNHERTTGEVPSTIQDFFDLDRFPGRRGMRRTPLANLEFALMADGVPASEIYGILDTEEGVERAFRKLDTIKDHVVWWDAGAQPPQMLADGEVVMSTAYNGRIFNAQVLENQPFTIVLARAGARKSATSPSSPDPGVSTRHDNSSRSPPGPVRWRPSAAISPTVRRAAQPKGWFRPTSPRVSPWVRTCPTHRRTRSSALRSDWQWWADNGDEMNERFAAWLLR